MPIVSTSALTLVFLLGALLGWRKPEWVSAVGSWVEEKRQIVWMSWLILFALVNLLPVAWLGLPQPAIHDEFSYWLGADTLAKGRLANPAIGGWESFETLYVQMLPSYASIYPPGSAATLALGKVIFGHPYWGLFLVYLSLAAALPWALLAFVEFRYAMAASLLVGGGVACTYWTHGYWGGALAALLGTLLVGALGRRGVGSALTLGIAAGALAFVRPFEGAVLVAGTTAVFAWKRPGLRSWFAYAGVLALCMAAWLGYNFAVTGNALVHPYFRYFSDYIAKPFFVGQRSKEVRFRHIEIELMLSGLGGLPDPVRSFVWKCMVFLFPMRPIAETGLIAAGMWFGWRNGQRFLVALCGLGALTVWYSRFAFPHYVAPYFGCLALLVAYGFVQLRGYKWLMTGALALALAADAEALFNMLRGRRDVRAMTAIWPTMEYPPYSMNFSAEGFVRRKEAVTLDLLSRQGPHLVFVKYDASHNPHEEWVFNGADIQKEEIVWARYYTAESREIVKKEFRGRVCWVLEPDLRPYRLVACD